MDMYMKATHYNPFEKYDITLVKSTRRVPFDEFLTNPVCKHPSIWSLILLEPNCVGLTALTKEFFFQLVLSLAFVVRSS